ncbi:hypothetical protein X994_2774 [Burkholderia pseudomallei]|nr:hypothetical protein X994_2774 [Burkholderia pseudomallei]
MAFVPKPQPRPGERRSQVSLNVVCLLLDENHVVARYTTADSHVIRQPLREMLGFSLLGGAIPNLRYITIDIAHCLRDRLRCVRVKRPGNDMLDPDKIGRRSKIEQKWDTNCAKVGSKTFKSIRPRAGPNHNALLVVADRGHRDIPVAKG